ncbi:ATP-binding protein [Tropicimonas sp. S265A]|uniref:ATP-binding protein n=1 Tax=Tropicimonas sp. S265A TaxID=3415134 RepID=UPI003C7EA33F
MTSHGAHKRTSITAGRAFAAVLIVSLAFAMIAFPRLERLFLLEAGEQGRTSLRLATEGLNGALRQYAPLPGLVAERNSLRALLADPGNTDLQAEVNEDLRQTAFRLKASDIYVMDITGYTVAASNYLKDAPFIGRSFNFRPYFTQALEGGLGRYFALGTTSGERGVFYAAPIEVGTRIVGVVALKFTVDGFEETWRDAPYTVMVSDLLGVVFMSDRVDLHFRALSPLSERDRQQIASSRQYPLDQVRPLPNTQAPLNADLYLRSFDEDGMPARYVSAQTRIPDIGWDVTILVPTGPARTRAFAVLAIGLLVTTAGGLALAIYLQRRARLMDRIAAQSAAQEMLETRVAQRTADLNRANAQLTEEVEERRATEAQLKRTQAELVQAGKLAALGQMSAALSHEFNQPLAAVKAYADNAQTLMERDRLEDAKDNIGRISQMADRMAAISRHLRNFARRPQEDVLPTPLTRVIEDALAMMDVRIKAQGTEVVSALPADEVWVAGGHVRLQQVVVNLISNALDAMEGLDGQRIELKLDTTADRCRLRVRDTGPGIDETEKTQIFDPFFTTKGPGKGLGLGLSISYNIVRDFGGKITAETHADGGAVFVLDLERRLAPHEQAAE